MRIKRERGGTSKLQLHAIELTAESLSEEKQLARFYLDLRNHSEGVLRMGARAEEAVSQSGAAPDYLEVRIFDRNCWVSREDFRILYGLAGNVTGAVKKYAELPEETMVVRVSIVRKGDRGGRKRVPPLP